MKRARAPAPVKRPRGRPPKLSADRVQQAALALVDRHGVAGLSMRSLAGELDAAAMTLYNHVRDREALDVLVVDAVLAEVRWARRAEWRAEAAAIATAVWSAIRAHPHAIPLILTRRSRSAPALAIAEAMLHALARGGLAGDRLLVAFRALTAFIMGFAQAELAGPLAVQAGESRARVIARFRSLPIDQFPHLVELAGRAASEEPEGQFRAGLRALLAGLAGS